MGIISFREFLTEAASKGVDFEWAIVYWALIESGLTDEDLQKRNPKLKPYGGKIDSDAKKAIKNIPKDILSTAYHSDELNISGNPEPKTDIVFGKNKEYKVSVKMSGMVQLASGEGKSTASMLKFVLDEFQKEGGIPDSAFLQIVEKIEEMPSKMVSPQNIARLEKEKSEFMNSIKLPDGTLNPKFDWKRWESENKSLIKSFLAEYVSKHPKFGYILIHEALTGSRTFSNGLAAANYIITPNKFVEIDDSYVNHVLGSTKIDLRAKSRSGITSATIRFDYKTEELVFEGKIFDFLKKVMGKVKSVFSKFIHSVFDKENQLNVTFRVE